jgi:hypothetical protein
MVENYLAVILHTQVRNFDLLWLTCYILNRYTRVKPKNRRVTQLLYIPVRERDVPMANYNYSVKRNVMQFSLLLLFVYGMKVFYYTVIF